MNISKRLKKFHINYGKGYKSEFLSRVTPKYLKKLIKQFVDFNSVLTFPSDSYRYSGKVVKTVSTIILSGKLHHRVGPYTQAFEREFADFHGTEYALSTNSGTSALELALKAVGVVPGDEVIVPDYTFVATAQAVLARGGIPVFADIDDTYTISPTSIKKLITKKTKAIIPVHMFGNVADMEAINKIARSHRLFIIEDVCQGFGSFFRDKRVGTLGDIGCFSFDINKAITTGQGGMLITSTKKYYDTAHMTRETGQMLDDSASDVSTTGNNYALTEIQSALGSFALKEVEKLNQKRRRLYEYFVETFNSSDIPIRWHRELPNTSNMYLRLVFMIDFSKLECNRQSFLQAMNSVGIPFKTFYPKPLHSYSLFTLKMDQRTKSSFPFNHAKSLDYRRTNAPFTTRFCEQQVGLNLSPYIEKYHIDYLCKQLRELLLSNRKSNR